MTTEIGLWIDHRKAVIIVIGDEREQIKVIVSHVDRQPSRIDGERSLEPYEPLQVSADDVTDRRFHQHLNTYYDEVIACVHHADSLLVFGPGEAKGELTKRLAQEKHSGRTVKLETMDKLTDKQIAAKVRGYFKKENSANAF